jgi:hypothetical protein
MKRFESPRGQPVVLLLAVAVALTLAAGASAYVRAGEPPPPNDNRIQAQAITGFPAGIAGTTVGATVERLDPQRSKCGTVESTVWYRIDKAPDGTISIGAQGSGFTPVVRVYNAMSSGIAELACASAKAEKRATLSWATTRGNTYLVLVGKKPGTHDAAFRLSAQLFLPPVNDAVGGASKLPVPGHVTGTTLGATSDDNDPDGCGLASNTVWFTVKPAAAARVVIRLHAGGNLDAAAVVVRKVRSGTQTIGCRPTDQSGNALLVWDVEKGASYLLVVGQREGSPAGTFSLESLASQPPEQAPGRRLPTAGVKGTLNGLTNVNDIWWTTFAAGTTYRIAFVSHGCANVTVSSRGEEMGSFECNGYTTFTPKPAEAGRYVFEVTAPHLNGSLQYSLKVAVAARDDVGVGTELANLKTVRGSLAPAAGDVVDLYHFDVQRLSDVRVRLDTGRTEFSVALLDYDGVRLGSSGKEIERNLGAGHYVVAVRAPMAAPAGTYRLSLVIRYVTKTTLTLSATTVPPRSAVVFTVAVTPPPSGGRIVLQIERFDPLTGWQFNRTVTLHAPTAKYSWTPPTAGRWRASAAYLGNLGSSPSRTGYSTILVAKPVGLNTGL